MLLPPIVVCIAARFVRIHEGNIIFYPGDETIEAGPLGTVLLPKNVPHHYRITCDYLGVTFIVTPGNAQGFFDELSAPAINNEIPEPTPPQRKLWITL